MENKQYDNTNRGALFKNEQKEQDTHADYNGSINIEGKEYWLNAWVNEAKQSGKKFFSLSVKAKDSSGSTTADNAPVDELDDSPF